MAPFAPGETGSKTAFVVLAGRWVGGLTEGQSRRADLLSTTGGTDVKVNLLECWVTSGTLVFKVEVWGSDGSWRKKRYASMLLSDIPEEVLTDIIGAYLDAQPEEDHHQTALF